MPSTSTQTSLSKTAASLQGSLIATNLDAQHSALEEVAGHLEAITTLERKAQVVLRSVTQLQEAGFTPSGQVVQELTAEIETLMTQLHSLHVRCNPGNYVGVSENYPIPYGETFLGAMRRPVPHRIYTEVVKHYTFNTIAERLTELREDFFAGAKPSTDLLSLIADALAGPVKRGHTPSTNEHPLAAYCIIKGGESVSLASREDNSVLKLAERFDALPEQEQRAFIWTLKSIVCAPDNRVLRRITAQLEELMCGPAISSYLTARVDLWRAAHLLDTICPGSDASRATMFETDHCDMDFIAQCYYAELFPLREALSSLGYGVPPLDRFLDVARALVRDRHSGNYQRVHGILMLLSCAGAEAVEEIILASSRYVKDNHLTALVLSNEWYGSYTRDPGTALQRFIVRVGEDEVKGKLGVFGQGIIEEAGTPARYIQNSDLVSFTERSAAAKSSPTVLYVEAQIVGDLASTDPDRWQRATSILLNYGGPPSSNTVAAIETFYHAHPPQVTMQYVEPVVARLTEIGDRGIQRLAMLICSQLSEKKGYRTRGSADTASIVANIFATRGIPQQQVLEEVGKVTGFTLDDLRATFTLLSYASDKCLHTFHDGPDNSSSGAKRLKSLLDKVAGILTVARESTFCDLVAFLSQHSYAFELKDLDLLTALLKDPAELEKTKAAFKATAHNPFVERYTLPELDLRGRGLLKRPLTDVEIHYAVRPLVARFFVCSVDDPSSTLGRIAEVLADNRCTTAEAIEACFWVERYRKGLLDTPLTAEQERFQREIPLVILPLIKGLGFDPKDIVFTDILWEMFCDPAKGDHFVANMKRHGVALISRLTSDEDIQLHLRGIRNRAEMTALEVALLPPTFYDSLLGAVPAVVTYHLIAPLRQNVTDFKAIQRMLAEPDRAKALIRDEVLLKWLASSTHSNASGLVLRLLTLDEPLSRKEVHMLPSIVDFYGFIHSRVDGVPEIGRRLSDGTYKDFTTFLSECLGALRVTLSQHFPPEVIEAIESEQLMEFAGPYLGMVHKCKFHTTAALKVLGLASLTGKQNLLWQGDSETIDLLLRELCERTDVHHELGELKTYQKRREESDRNHPFISALNKEQKKVWMQKPEHHEHIIGEACLEDRLLSVQALLKGCFEGGHISAEIIALTANRSLSAEMRDMAERWRALGTRDDDNAKAERHKIRERQKHLKKYNSLVALSRADEKISGCLHEIAQQRTKLGQHSGFITELGFDFDDSFGNRIFRGELEVLLSRLEGYRGTKHADDIVTIASAIKTLEQKANSLLGEITRDAIASISTLRALPGNEQAVADCGAIHSVVNGGDVGLAVFNYSAERCFYRDLQGTVGQCLDYRTGENSRHNLAWGDGIADMGIARDERGVARVNALIYGVGLLQGDSVVPAIALDTPYTPDGSPMTWDKLEGMIRFAGRRAQSLGVPLILPASSLSAYEIDARHLLRSLATSSQRVYSGKISMRIAPGVSGSLYIEAEEFAHYTEPETLQVQALVLD